MSAVGPLRPFVEASCIYCGSSFCPLMDLDDVDEGGAMDPTEAVPYLHCDGCHRNGVVISAEIDLIPDRRRWKGEEG